MSDATERYLYFCQSCGAVYALSDGAMEYKVCPAVVFNLKKGGVVRCNGHFELYAVPQPEEPRP